MKNLAFSLIVTTASLMPASAGEFLVEVSGIVNSQGSIRALVFEDAKGFPENREQALWEISVKASEARAGKLLLTFPGIRGKSGVVAIIHDWDDSGTLHKNLLGMPREPVAISGWDGKGRPQFARCAQPLTGIFKLSFRQP